MACATSFPLKGSMSLDSHSPTAPYESSSFATPQAGAQQPVLYIELLLRKCLTELYCPPAQRGEGGAVGTKGGKAAEGR